MGAQVRKGEHGTTVVYAKTIERAEDDPESGKETIERIPLLRAYTMFNTEQIDGLPTQPEVQPTAIEPVSFRIDRVDASLLPAPLPSSTRAIAPAIFRPPIASKCHLIGSLSIRRCRAQPKVTTRLLFAS